MPKTSERYPGESFESIFRRFKKAVDRAGTLQDLKEREFYVSPSNERKVAAKAAKKRWQKYLREQEMELAELRRPPKAPE